MVVSVVVFPNTEDWAGVDEPIRPLLKAVLLVGVGAIVLRVEPDFVTASRRVRSRSDV